MDSNDIKKRLLLQQELEYQSEALVDLAEKALSKERRPKASGSEPNLSQFNNLQEVALETRSPTVVVNWLCYQMGRKETKNWATSGIGDLVVEDMKSLRTRAQAIVKRVYGQEDEISVQDVHITLIRRYLGYLKRWFVSKGGRHDFNNQNT